MRTLEIGNETTTVRTGTTTGGPEDIPSCWSRVGRTRSLAEREMKNRNGTSHRQRKKKANT